MNFAFFSLALLASVVQAGTLSDAAFGYTIDLPAGWVQVKTRDLQHHFKDGSGHYPSRISIVRSAIDKADYPTPASWTEAQFIAYKLAVETSAFPYGNVTYYDSSSVRTLGSDWAPEAFSMLFPGDGQRTYCEFVRYCAHGDFGYEIYALGDSADMMNQVDYYAGIIETVTFNSPIVAIHPRGPAGSSSLQAGLPIIWVDPLGRISVGTTSSSGEPVRRRPVLLYRYQSPSR